MLDRLWKIWARATGHMMGENDHDRPDVRGPHRPDAQDLLGGDTCDHLFLHHGQRDTPLVSNLSKTHNIGLYFRCTAT